MPKPGSALLPAERVGYQPRSPPSRGTRIGSMLAGLSSPEPGSGHATMDRSDAIQALGLAE